MSKEDVYKKQLQELGVYNPIFDGEIHQLCILERELARARKAWKATAPNPKAAPNFTDPHYEIIRGLERDILQHRDALGLTPKALARLRKQQPPTENEAPAAFGNQALGTLLTELRLVSNE